MKPTLLLLLLVTSCAPVAAVPGREAASQAERLLAGRTAGAPTGCVNLRDTRRSHILAQRRAILFEGRGASHYVNHPRGGCPDLREDLALRTSTPTGLLCEGDIVQLQDRASGMSHGACSLGRFTPYSRTR